jgi:hypothetical protein
MKKHIFLTILLMSGYCIAPAQVDRTIDSLLNQYVLSSANKNAGMIGTIEDYLRMMAYISNQPEFKTMTDWVKVVKGWCHGLGLEGEGSKIIYPGNSGANL